MPQALFLHAAGDARVEPYAPPPPGPGETRVRVAAVGLCGSDLHYFKDGGIGAAQVRAPFVPGHEIAAWLTGDLPGAGLRKGALVAVDPNVACGTCDWCRKGWHNLCPHVRFIGAPPYDGAMATEMNVPVGQILPLPEGFTPARTAMLEPLGVAIHALDLARPHLGERATVLGCGPVGLLVVQLLRLAGAGEVLAIDPQPHRRALAARLGATRVAAGLAEAADWNGGEGSPLVVEFTNAREGFAEAVAAARIGGRLVLGGIPDGDSYVLPAAPARRRGLGVKFVRRMGDDYPRAMALVAAGRIDVDSLVSHRLPLAEGPAAFRRHAEGAADVVKTVLYPNGVC